MPLYHTMGIHSLLAMHLVGGCYVPQARWDPDEALRLIQERADHLAVPRTHPVPRPRQRPSGSPSTISSVRALGYAGAAMTSTVAARAWRSSGRGVREPLRLDRGVHVLDRPRPGRQARLRRPSVRQHPPQARAGGEICAHITGDEAFAGYWNRPDADAKAVHDGWYHTGDTGHLDADGDLWSTAASTT